MKISLKNIYINSPFWLKRIFCNAEAIRRDTFRKYGSYKEEYMKIDFEKSMENFDGEGQKKKLSAMLSEVRENVPFYKEVSADAELSRVPVLTKEIMAKRYGDIIDRNLDVKECFKGVTSGSTGKPVRYYTHKEAVRKNKIYQEKFYEFLGIGKRDRTVRFSGVPIKVFENKKPPFGVYIDKYRQLQMSSYHLDEATAGEYIAQIKKYKCNYGTGYAKTWLFFAEHIERCNLEAPKLKVIITDSEGINSEQQSFVENVFGCKVHQTYGLSETGQIAVQCRCGKYHIVPDICICETLDEDLEPAGENELGQIYLTGLVTHKTPIIRYATGDLGVLKKGVCECGWSGQYLEKIEGRVDDYVLTADGRKIGRLSHIMKEAVGVYASQIIQKTTDSVEIHVLPDNNFDKDSMERVCIEAKKYLGDFKITWKTKDKLRKTDNGKIKYVIRELQ